MDKNEYRAKLDEINDLVEQTIRRQPETSFDGSSQSAYWKNGIVPAGGAVC